MSTKKLDVGAKYRMYFNYDNDKKVYCIPVLPETIQITVKGKSQSIDISNFGEALVKGKREGMAISFSSFFPKSYGATYCACAKSQFKSPAAWHSWMIALENGKLPCHFVLEGSPLKLNMYVVIQSYKASEEGGDVGTISYTVEMKEYRVPEVTKYKVTTKVEKKKKKTKAKKKSSGKRVDNKKKPKTYTVKKGDCLWNIAKKFYGNGAQYKKIYNANKNKIKNPNIIQIGWKLTIP